jgi:hypothetical protein
MTNKLLCICLAVFLVTLTATDADSSWMGIQAHPVNQNLWQLYNSNSTKASVTVTIVSMWSTGEQFSTVFHTVLKPKKSGNVTSTTPIVNVVIGTVELD